MSRQSSGARARLSIASTPVSSIVPELLISYYNYEQWSWRVKTYLMAENLWDFVEPSNGEVSPQPKPEDGEAYKDYWRSWNAKALYVIQNSCGSDMLSIIPTTSTAKVAWKALEMYCKEKQKADKDVKNFEPYIPFTDYVASGEWREAKRCLKELPDAVRMRDPRNGYETALHLAARNGHLQTVEWLISVTMTEKDKQSKNVHGYTALHEAVSYGFLEIVKVLMPVMGQVKSSNGDTTLHLALKCGQVHLVKELKLLMTQEDLRLTNDDGFTALHLAVIYEHLDIVEELMPLMGEIKDCDGNTVFHMIVDLLDTSKVKNLVKSMRREDLVIRNNDGYTTFDLAFMREDVSIVRELVSYDYYFDRYIPFIDFIYKGEWKKAKECLGGLESYVQDALRARDPRDKHGNTVLHVAAKQGHAYIVKELILLVKQESLEETKVGGVCLEESQETIIREAKQFIEENECVSEQRNSFGETALHIAVSEKHVHVVQDLVKFMRKEGFEVKDGAGSTALHRAVVGGNVDIVKELVACMRREGLSLQNAEGSLALHCAVKVKEMQTSIVKELVLAMSPEALEIKDYEGHTALHCALEKHHLDEDVKEMAKYMAEKNVNVFAIDMPRFGLPVVWACLYGRVELSRYLYKLTPPEAFNGYNGIYLISVCIKRMNNFDIALHLLQHYPRLALLDDGINDFCPVLILARMHYAFLSGIRLTFWKKWIYNTISIQLSVDFNIPDVCIEVSEVDDHREKRDEPFIFLVARLFKSCVEKIFCKHWDHVYKMKHVHLRVRQLLDCIGKLRDTEKLPSAESNLVKASVFRAIEKGNFEFVTHMVKTQEFEDTYDGEDKNIFHLAIEHRQENIYNHIYRLNEEKRNQIGRDAAKGNNLILHAAGKPSIAARSRLDQIQGASLQMQRELQWFKEVESIVPVDVREATNEIEGMTGRELFTKNHKQLMEEAEKSIKATASSCTVVGSLIATMMFAAAFTVPGGNNDNTGFPVFVNNDLFLAFIVSDTLSLVSSTTSVIIFLGLLTSRYAEDDHLTSLPNQMMLGLFTLFLSIATMMIAFSYALIIMLHEECSWIITPTIILGSVPILSFVWVQFPLLFKTFISTYGPGVFGKEARRPWYKTLMKAVVSCLGFSKSQPKESTHEAGGS